MKWDWDQGHTAFTGTANAALSAWAVAAVGHETGLPQSWALGAAALGAVGSCLAGYSGAKQLTRRALGLRAASWLAAGGWMCTAIDNPWSTGTVGSLMGLACFFGAGAKGMTITERKAAKAEQKALLERFRTGLAAEWEDRLARVTGVQGCRVIGVRNWQKNTGFTIEIKLPGSGATWRTLSAHGDALASDADLPAGCGVEIAMGASRGLCVARVSTVNALEDTVDLPHDATPLDFAEDFDIGVHRDGSPALVNMRQNSGMLAGDKRSGKTNQLQGFISRFVRMPNLLVWVIDFNGGGVALPWLQAWDEAGRPGRPPIDWVASNDREAEAMVKAGVAIAIKRKQAYQKLMRKANTDLLPVSAETPGIMIITDEGAEILGNPQRRFIADPYKEILRIAGAVAVNELSCFLRATADVTGDPIIKSQSRTRVGMRMASEDEIAYLLGWKSGVGPEDMPDRGYGAVTQDTAQPAKIFKGYRVLPSDIDWMVQHTSELRPELDQISREAAGELYETRWAPERSGYLFDGSEAPSAALETAAAPEPPAEAASAWEGRPKLSPEQSRANLRKAVEEADAAEPVDDFQRVLDEAGVADPADPATWAEADRPAAAVEDETESLRAFVYGLVREKTRSGGVSVADIRAALESAFGEEGKRSRETVTKWLREDDRIESGPGYGRWVVRPDEV